MRAEISRSLHDRLIAAAAASPTAEICGLLLSDPNSVRAGRSRSTGLLDFAGDDRVCIASVACATNVSPSPADSFEIDPATLFAVHRAERAGGPRLLGPYHSHPYGPAHPSPRDAAAAEPGRLWLILGQGEARLWLAQPRARFVAVPLVVA